MKFINYELASFAEKAVMDTTTREIEKLPVHRFIDTVQMYAESPAVVNRNNFSAPHFNYQEWQQYQGNAVAYYNKPSKLVRILDFNDRTNGSFTYIILHECGHAHCYQYYPDFENIEIPYKEKSQFMKRPITKRLYDSLPSERYADKFAEIAATGMSMPDIDLEMRKFHSKLKKEVDNMTEYKPQYSDNYNSRVMELLTDMYGLNSEVLEKLRHIYSNEKEMSSNR